MNSQAGWQIEPRLKPEQIIRNAEEDQKRFIEQAINAYHRRHFAAEKARKKEAIAGLVVVLVSAVLLVAAAAWFVMRHFNL